jgi:hypothetical protein
LNLRKTPSTSKAAFKSNDLVDLNENFNKMRLPISENLDETSETVQHENFDDADDNDVIDELNFKSQDQNDDSNYETHSDDEEQLTKLVNK